MPENTTSPSAPAAPSAPGASPTPTPAGPQPYAWPELRPQHDADFTTPAKGEWVNGAALENHTYTDARAVACRLSASLSGNGSPDQVDVVFRVEPGQMALLDGDHALSDVGGMHVFGTFSFNGRALDISTKSLERAGYNAHAALDNLLTRRKDPEALGLAQQLRTDPSCSQDDLASAMGLLALQRGDLAACSLGSKVVRLTVKLDEFPLGSGKIRRRLGFVNSIPVAAQASDVLSLARKLRGGAAPATGQRVTPPSRDVGGARAGASAAPAGAPNKDDVDF